MALFLGLQKRRIEHKVKAAKELIHDGKLDLAEKEYLDILEEYTDFCKKGSYSDKMSMYKHIMDIYGRLSKHHKRERKPAAVKPIKKKAKRKTKKIGIRC